MLKRMKEFDAGVDTFNQLKKRNFARSNQQTMGRWQ
jgi:hypothetical protein